VTPTESMTGESAADTPPLADETGMGVAAGTPPLADETGMGVAATPTAAPIEPNGCPTCNEVPCGYCQQGCPGSPCTYESSIDKAGSLDRNWCANDNFGHFPPTCRKQPVFESTASADITVVIATTEVSFSQPLSISEQETAKSTYKVQLDTWYSSLVFTVALQASRRSVTTYTLLGTAETSNPAVASSTATPSLSVKCTRALASQLSTALPGVTNSGVTTSVTSKLELTEADNQEDTGGSGMENSVLIGMMVGAVAIAGVVGLIAYREWSRRQITTCDDMLGVLDSPTASKPHSANPLKPYVDHIAGHQVADIDASCLSEMTDSQFDFSEQNSEMFREVSFSEESLCDLKRSYSALCADEAGVPIEVVQEVLKREGRDESVKAQVLTAAQAIWNLRDEVMQKNKPRSSSDSDLSQSFTEAPSA